LTDLHTLAHAIGSNAELAMHGDNRAHDQLRTELKALNPQQAEAVAAELQSTFGARSNALLPGVSIDRDNAGGITAITFEPTLQDRLLGGARAVETTMAPIYQKGSSPDFFREMREYYDELPSKIRNYLKLVPTDFIATDLTPHADPSLHGTPPGYDKGETYNAVRGLEEPNEPGNPRPGHIIMSEFFEHLDKGKQASQDLHETFLHEVGHKVDMIMGNVSEVDVPGNTGPTFKKAYDADLAAMPQSIKDRFHYYLQPGVPGRREAFAQCFSYVEGGSDVNRKLFYVYFPNSIKFVEKELTARGLSQGPG